MLNLICDFTSVMTTIGRVLLAFVILMFMVLIHETGHYVAGKILGFKINEFAVGMGPKLLSKTKKNGEVVSLRLLPLGGFCAFEGENEDGESSPSSFNRQKPWKRLIVLFCGAFFNFLSAILIGIIAFACYGDNFAKVNYVYDYTTTANQQLQQGDLLYKIDGKRVFILDGIDRYMSDDEDMTFVVLRPKTDQNGNTSYEKVTLKGLTKNPMLSCVITKAEGDFTSTDGEYKLSKNDVIYKINGVSISKSGQYAAVLSQLEGECTITVGCNDGVLRTFKVDSASFAKNSIVAQEQTYSGIGFSMTTVAHKFGFGEAVARTFPFCGEVAMLVLRTLGGLITGVVGVESVGGPITTISMTSQIVATGFGNILRLIVLISVNLAVFNLLPVPALDGCQMVFVIIEWIARKPINRKVQNYINGIGLVLLIGLMILIDLLKL